MTSDEEARGRFGLLVGLDLALTRWTELQTDPDFRFMLHEAGYTVYEWGELILSPHGARSLARFRRWQQNERLRRQARRE